MKFYFYRFLDCRPLIIIVTEKLFEDYDFDFQFPVIKHILKIYVPLPFWLIREYVKLKYIHSTYLRLRKCGNKI